jgi:hypothetical protein
MYTNQWPANGGAFGLLPSFGIELKYAAIVRQAAPTVARRLVLPT